MTAARFGVVVVGVDGSAVADDALRFAADEAAQRSARLVIVHAGKEPGWSPCDPPAYELRADADSLRTESVEIAMARHPALRCETVARSDDAARLLVELSAEADVVVVGTHRTGRVNNFVLGSVSQRVAAQAWCPVIAVSGPAPATPGPIVLGASASPGGLAALRFACAEARIRQVTVRCLRAVDESVQLEPGPHSAAGSTLDELARIAAHEYPDVHFVGEVCDASPLGALETAARDASLLVLGTRRVAAEPLPHLGPIGSWLLHQTQCPLVIVNDLTSRVGAREVPELATTWS